MSFYRTYRPQLIDEIDNAHVREQVLSLLKKDLQQLPHAYLLTGPKGAGKTTTARILAKLYTCTKFSKKTGPCGSCDQCMSVEKGTNMDVLEIDAASNRGIDEIRELRDRISLSPVLAAYKIYIIDEVHMLTTEAFNALLKTLEEPPKHAVFILATTDPQKVPATIKSRCVGISFRKATDEELIHALEKITTKEKIAIDTDALAFIASVADGAFRDAVKLLEQVSFSDGTISIDKVTDLLSTSDSALREQFLDAVHRKNQKESFAVLKTLIDDTKDIKLFITDILHDLEHMLIASVSHDYHGIWQQQECQRFISFLLTAFGQMKISPIVELPLELAVIGYCGDPSSVLHPSVSPKPAVETQEKPVEKQEEKRVEKPIEEKKTDTEEKTASGKKEPERSVDPVADEDDHTSDFVTLEKLQECWKEVIEALKPYNHSVAGVMRSAKPYEVGHGVITIVTQYAFHQERLSEPKVRDILATVFKKLFGVKVRVDVVLKK